MAAFGSGGPAGAGGHREGSALQRAGTRFRIVGTVPAEPAGSTGSAYDVSSDWGEGNGMSRLGKAASLLLAGVASVALVTVANAGQASACTVPPNTAVYCWPSGGSVPPPHRP